MDITRYPRLRPNDVNERHILETVLSLHETLVSLRTALHQTRSEVEQLRSHAKICPHINDKRQFEVLKQSDVRESSCRGLLPIPGLDSGETEYLELPSVSCKDKMAEERGDDIRRNSEGDSKDGMQNTGGCMRDGSLEAGSNGSLEIKSGEEEKGNHDEESKEKEDKLSREAVKCNHKENNEVESTLVSGTDHSTDVEVESIEKDFSDKEDEGETLDEERENNVDEIVVVSAETGQPDTYVVIESQRQVLTRQKVTHRESRTTEVTYEADAESGNEESEEVDDIELIFTTDDTTELPSFQENLVSIQEGDGWNQGQQGTPVMLKFSEASQFEDSVAEEEEDADESKECGIKPKEQFENVDGSDGGPGLRLILSANGPDVKRDLISPGRDKHLLRKKSSDDWEPDPCPIETDISKIGREDDMVLEDDEVDDGENDVNTGDLAPGQHGPIMFKVSPPGSSRSDAVRRRSRTNSECKASGVRPILVERNYNKKENEAQTEISALPSHWRSESYLAHKVSTNFTTLPSKFAIPLSRETHHQQGRQYSSPKHYQQQPVMTSTPRGRQLKPSEKNQEARRALLSDINFTSRIPELSHSADYLCDDIDRIQRELHDHGPEALYRFYPRAFPFLHNTGSPSTTTRRSYEALGPEPLVSPTTLELARSRRRFSFQNGSCNCSCHIVSAPINRLQKQKMAFWSSIPSPRPGSYEAHNQKHWTPAPLESPLGSKSKWTWSSVPSSPTHYHVDVASNLHTTASLVGGFSGIRHHCCPETVKRREKKSGHRRSRVTFKDASTWRGSLPDLRSGESTDSLVDEAEEYVRQSIDSLVTRTYWDRVGLKRRQWYRSDPDLVREIRPPPSSRPYLPKSEYGLRIDSVVKIIAPDGRVLIGRVRYVGKPPRQLETFVGVELPSDYGNSDGTFEGHRLFDCEPEKAIFVPFRKVVLAWSP